MMKLEDTWSGLNHGVEFKYIPRISVVGMFEPVAYCFVFVTCDAEIMVAWDVGRGLPGTRQLTFIVLFKSFTNLGGGLCFYLHCIEEEAETFYSFLKNTHRKCEGSGI